jgi:hypothetical protein
MEGPLSTQKTLNGGCPTTGMRRTIPSCVVNAADIRCAWAGYLRINSHTSMTALNKCTSSPDSSARSCCWATHETGPVKLLTTTREGVLHRGRSQCLGQQILKFRVRVVLILGLRNDARRFQQDAPILELVHDEPFVAVTWKYESTSLVGLHHCAHK